MKRISLIGTLGALALAMLVPAGASAHTPPVYWTDLLKSTCVNEGGATASAGSSSGWRLTPATTIQMHLTPNYIVIRSKFQQKVDGAWATIGSSSVTTPVHPDGDQNVFSNLLHRGLLVRVG